MSNRHRIALFNLPERYLTKNGGMFCKNFMMSTTRKKSNLSIHLTSSSTFGVIEKAKNGIVIKMYDELVKKIAVDRKKKLEEKGFKP